jgi:uncharacterized protein (TIGR02594 family)
MQEIRGPVDNPEIVQMFADVGHSSVQDDETAWCAAFVGSHLKRAGLPHTGKLTARSYLDWGQPVNDPEPGDIVVFWRGSRDGWQGHVGFYVSETATHINVLGGNQSNKVSVQAYPKDRLLGYRRMPGALMHPDPQEQAPRGLAGIITRIFAFLGKGGPA